ncbi:Ig-like domain-containing protein, partial [Geminicoccus harenae]
MPIARPDHFATQPGQPVTIAPFANDEGASLTFLGFSSPANGTVAPGPAANTLIYTPQLGFSGVDQFTYTVGDTTGEAAQAVVTITVSAANLQPV